MANRGNGSVVEGRSHTRPPYFDGSNYGTWKLKMKIFIQSQDRLLWRTIVKGFNYPTKKVEGNNILKDEDVFDFEEAKLFDFNVRAMNLIYCAINDEEFNRVSVYESAKEIWDRLEVTYEGTPELKESRISILMDKFEKFKMIKGESIDEMHKRYLEIVHPLKNLGKSFAPMELVKKLMKSIIPPYTSKIDAIEEGRDFESITLDILVSKLLKKEMEIKREDEDRVKGKSIALRATSSTCSSSDEDNDREEIAMLSKRIKNLMKKKELRKKMKKKHFRREISSEEDDEVICYKCKKPGHIQPQCPLYKNSKHKKKKAMVATWSDDDSSPSNSNDEKVNAHFAFMAFGDSEDEVSSNSSSTHELSYKELQNAFDELVEGYNKLKSLYKKNKKSMSALTSFNDELNAKVVNLLSEKECLKIELEASKVKLDDACKYENELSSMQVKYNQMVKANELLQSECLALKKYNVDISTSLSKISLGQKHAKTILAPPRQTQKYCFRHVHKTNIAHSSSNPQIICNYCERLGHIAHTCPYKRSNVKAIWAPKCAKTNANGPKVTWVPKTKN
jgi:hypothetical protein